MLVGYPFMTVNPRTFRKTLGCFPTGVTVVTTLDQAGAPVGVTVSSFTSLSLEPPLVLFCLDSRNPNLGAFQAAGHFAVNVLRQEQRELSIRFASRLEDKWKGVTWEAGALGSPLLPGCLATLECRLSAIHEGGDHQIIIGQVEGLEHAQGGQPLLYFRGAYTDFGCTAPLA